jgi:hypothetical protein
VNWDRIRAGLEDELYKIAEVSLAGLSANTVLNYPAPQPMPSAAYEKAQAILQKAQQFQSLSAPQEEEEKEAAARTPDSMPGMERLLRLRRRRQVDEPPPGKMEKVKSFAGHTIAGAGTAKFVHDWVDAVHHATKNTTDHHASPRAKALAISAGGLLGTAEYFRKQHRKKKWEQGKLKASTVLGTMPGSVIKPPSIPGISKTPSIKSMVPKIGTRGALPTPGPALPKIGV